MILKLKILTNNHPYTYNKELQVITLLLEGRRNPEVREILQIPKMTYYTLLKRLRIKYIDNGIDLAESDVVSFL